MRVHLYLITDSSSLRITVAELLQITVVILDDDDDGDDIDDDDVDDLVSDHYQSLITAMTCVVR